MSEFRLFCWGAFIADSLFAIALARGEHMAPGNLYVQILAVGFLGGVVAVTAIGGRLRDSGSHAER